MPKGSGGWPNTRSMNIRACVKQMKQREREKELEKQERLIEKELKRQEEAAWSQPKLGFVGNIVNATDENE